nr:hypothetical protein CFP56_21629 [Quercus suber]
MHRLLSKERTSSLATTSMHIAVLPRVVIDSPVSSQIELYRPSSRAVQMISATENSQSSVAITAANQGWSIGSRVLREYVEFFGPRTEQLDIVATDSKASFISYTEKISDGKGKIFLSSSNTC